jgi:hypothetical protein
LEGTRTHHHPIDSETGVILSFRWHTLTDVDRERSYVALLGVVHLRDVRLLPVFMRFGAHIERQLRRSSGAVGYRTGAEVTRLGFYHLSAWEDSDSIQEFVQTAPHLDAVERLTGRLGPTTFRYWVISGSHLPMHFGSELHRLG